MALWIDRTEPIRGQELRSAGLKTPGFKNIVMLLKVKRKMLDNDYLHKVLILVSGYFLLTSTTLQVSIILLRWITFMNTLYKASFTIFHRTLGTEHSCNSSDLHFEPRYLLLLPIQMRLEVLNSERKEPKISIRRLTLWEQHHYYYSKAAKTSVKCKCPIPKRF